MAPVSGADVLVSTAAGAAVPVLGAVVCAAAVPGAAVPAPATPVPAPAVPTPGAAVLGAVVPALAQCSRACACVARSSGARRVCVWSHDGG
ncbi:hypothetical protein CesoFtcFv8_016948 [Champsocephalus esox]|uniref:Uncharacterized protein n=1 Tax=Champsocephalus esox TaxID=159716 RepID=A0AAN8BJC2_9TELE|nr:hypothetical protein CesoFtcFv8_016948 [Champsocephalus esox]